MFVSANSGLLYPQTWEPLKEKSKYRYIWTLVVAIIELPIATNYSYISSILEGNL